MTAPAIATSAPPAAAAPAPSDAPASGGDAPTQLEHELDAIFTTGASEPLGFADAPAGSPAGSPPAAGGPSGDGQTRVDAPAPAGGPTDTPTGGAPAASGDAAAGTPPADDPLAGAVPFTYGADGRTLEGVHRFPGEGVMIPEANVHVLETLLTERDALDQASQEYAQRIEDYERATSYAITDANGREQTVRGAEGVAEMRVKIGHLFAEVEGLRAVLEDPAKILKLLARDGNDKLVLDPDAMDALNLRISTAARTAEDAIRAQLATLTPRREAPAPRASSSGQPTGDLSAHAPRLIDGAAQQARVDATLLTEQDRTFLASQLPRYVRQVKESDRRFNPSLRIGDPIIDEAFTNLVKHQATVRADAARAARAAADAAAANAPKIAASQPPKVAAPVAPAANTQQKPPAKESDSDRIWRMRQAMAGGRFAGGMTADESDA